MHFLNRQKFFDKEIELPKYFKTNHAFYVFTFHKFLPTNFTAIITLKHDIFYSCRIDFNTFAFANQNKVLRLVLAKSLTDPDKIYRLNVRREMDCMCMLSF